MKKIFILFSLIFACIIYTSYDYTGIQAAEYSSNVDKTGLGYSINAVKTAYIDVSEIRTGSPIFDSNWLTMCLSILQPENIRYSSSSYFSSSNFEEINASINSEFNYNSSVNMDCSLFTSNSKMGFKNTSIINYSSYMSQYYYAFISMFDRYSLTLPNYSSNLTTYREKLHPNFVSEVTKFFTINSYENAKKFFDMYGTHLIAKGIYGGKFEAYYSALSNYIDVGGELRTSITNDINLGMSGLVEVGNAFDYNLSQSIGSKSSICMETFKASSWGGNPFSVSSIANFNTVYNSWLSTIDDKPTLIRTSSDGLIPLWELLPKKYNTLEYKNIMKEYFIQYANEYILAKKEQKIQTTLKLDLL